MTTTEDFTALPEGTNVAMAGTVVRCPACGRNGILEPAAERPSSCVHAAQSTMLGDGMLTEPTDCCEIR